MTVAAFAFIKSNDADEVTKLVATLGLVRVPVTFAAGMLVRAEPEPENVVAVITFAAKLPATSRATIVEAEFALFELRPSSKSAFRLVTSVVEDTVNGAVPVAIVEVNTLFVEIAPSTVIAVLNKRAMD